MKKNQLFKNGQRQQELRTIILDQQLTAWMTDDERAAFYGLPEGCRMREGAKILSLDKFECGSNVWIGEQVILDASGELVIGDHTSIGSHSLIWSHSSFLSNLMEDNSPNNPYIFRRKTSIGKGCLIAGPSVVYPGVSIGNHVIVLPMSVVTEDIKDNCMVGGSPAQFIKKVDQNYIDGQLKTLKKDL